ncbi:glycosyltransferase family 4 protein [Arcticibacter sp. MXS-1]|uniref:glycosyltransferase family 4 protein n=1 Tax=Arcticibacter sp. MXS-1 TaxID=3341726 RepID=UPI0035A97B04
MRVAVVATYDVTNVKYWSGTAFYIFSLLKKHYDVTPVEVSLKRSPDSLIRGAYYNRVLGKKYFVSFDRSFFKHNEAYLDTVFRDKYDLIVTYDYFLIPSLSKYAKDVVLITDATFDNLLNYYDYRTNLCRLNVEDGHSLQMEAFSKLSYAFFSSDWAISNAVSRYGASPDKLKILFYGSNLSESLAEKLLQETVEKRMKTRPLQIFFPAIVWDRKGGDYAIAVVDRLNRMGIQTKLMIAGCSVPEGTDEQHIVNIGYQDKRDPLQERRLIDLYKSSHFLIMPSKADCTPIVFSEANSFALPVIASKTGGLKQ